MRRVAAAIGAILLGLPTLLGCAGQLRQLHPFPGTRSVGCSGPNDDAVEITYLGTAGMILRRGPHAVMAAPFYSNPNLAQVVFGLPIRPNRQRIDALLPDVRDVEGILVGHAHYDHLMDAFYVAEQYARRATLYGSDTMAHIAAASGVPRARVTSLERRAGDWWTAGRWEPIGDGSAIRVMALRSEHAPHALGITAFGGHVDRDRESLPWNAYGWKEGQTLAFLVDFLNGDGSVALRVHLQDSASNPPYGFPPLDQLGDDHGVDVAILCVASFDNVRGYPDALLRYLRPRHVVLTHWDDFFHCPECPARVVPGIDTREFAARVTSALPDGARWHTPDRNATLRICLGHGPGQIWPPAGSQVSGAPQKHPT